MTTEIAPLFDYLQPLNEAVDEIANTWRPDDPEYRADVYRQIMMQFSYGYFAFFHADRRAPGFRAAVEPGLHAAAQPGRHLPLLPDPRRPVSYRLSGNRGTVKMLLINTQGGLPGVGVTDHTGACYADIDDGDLTLDANGNFELLLSAENARGLFGRLAADQTGRIVPDDPLSLL